MTRIKVRSSTSDELNDFFAKMSQKSPDKKYVVEKWQDKENVQVWHADYVEPNEDKTIVIPEQYWLGYELDSADPQEFEKGLRIRFKNEVYTDYNNLFGKLDKNDAGNIEINKMQDYNNIKILHTKLKLVQENSPKDFMPYPFEDYNLLLNRPKINGIELFGDRAMEEFGAYAYDDTEVRELIAERQEKLIPGDNVVITNNVISAEVTAAVNTVNGLTGDIQLTAADVNAIDEDNELTNMDIERLLG